MKAKILRQKENPSDSDHAEAQDADKMAREILDRFQERESWDLSQYPEEEQYTMLVCCQRR